MAASYPRSAGRDPRGVRGRNGKLDIPQTGQNFFKKNTISRTDQAFFMPLSVLGNQGAADAMVASKVPHKRGLRKLCGIKVWTKTRWPITIRNRVLFGGGRSARWPGFENGRFSGGSSFVVGVPWDDARSGMGGACDGGEIVQQKWVLNRPGWCVTT